MVLFIGSCQNCLMLLTEALTECLSTTRLPNYKEKVFYIPPQLGISTTVKPHFHACLILSLQVL